MAEESKPDAEPQSHAQPEIKSDDDWKERVKAEDARRDAESTAADGPSQEAPTDGAAEPSLEDVDPSQLPPANFAVLVQSFSTQAMVALGLIPNPATGKSEWQPVLAKHFIDLLAVIEEKTEGNLSQDESRLLDDSLHQLRMAYVELSKRSP